MRFVSLEIESFGPIDRACIEFGPGLNVLHGPNDLGKSTVAKAIRAALLLPVTSSERREFESWTSGKPPRVQLVFELDGRRWRVDKTFADGSRGTATLAFSNDGTHFTKHEQSRGVDGALRQMLRFGIREPGGKGAPKGLPTSFLTTALLGQGTSLEALFSADLSRDGDDAGRQALTEALQTLAEDPLFKQLLTEANTHIDLAKTATGQWRRGRESPTFKIAERIVELERLRDELANRADESERVRSRLDELSARREELVARRHAADVRHANLTALHAAAARWRKVADGVYEARARLAEFTFARDRQRDLDREIERLGHEVSAATSSLGQARATREQTRAAVAVAERALAEAASAGTDAAVSTAENRQMSVALELREVVEKLTAIDAAIAIREHAVAVERVGIEQAARLEQLARRAAEANEALSRADAAMLEQERAVQCAAARASIAAWARAEQTQAHADALRARARLGLEAAAARRALVEARALPGESELGQALRLESELQIAERVAAVGIGVRLELLADTQVQVARDDHPPERVRPVSEHRAELDLSLAIDGVGTVVISAGAADARAQLAGLRTRWARDVVPMLRAANIDNLDALAQAVGDTRAELDAVARVEAEAHALAREAAAHDRPSDELAQLAADAAAARAVLDEQPEPDTAMPTAAALEQARTAVANSREAARARANEAGNELAIARANHQRITHDLEDARIAAARTRDELPGDLATLRAEQEDRRSALAAEQLTLESRLAELRARSDAARAGRATELTRAQLSDREAAAAITAAEEDLLARRERLAAASARREENAARLRGLDGEALVAAVEVAESEQRACPQPERTVAEEEIALARRQLDDLEAQLADLGAETQKTEGRLEQVGGDALRRSAQETEQALTEAKRREDQIRFDVEAWELLRDTLREVEDSQALHLGTALARAVEERLARLTVGRYAQVEIDRDLRTTGLRADGAARAIDMMSSGVKEQLATLVRLAIAEQLGSAVILDDHLAQTDPDRVEFFRTLLRDVGERVQILVLTCRPGDYLTVAELAGQTSSVRSIDALRVLVRGGVAAEPQSPP